MRRISRVDRLSADEASKYDAIREKTDSEYGTDSGPMFLILAGAFLILLSLLMAGGCSRSYRYTTAEGAVVEIEIAGGDSSFGSLRAVKTQADGDSIELVIENFTMEQKLAETISAIADGIQTVR